MCPSMNWSPSPKVVLHKCLSQRTDSNIMAFQATNGAHFLRHIKVRGAKGKAHQRARVFSVNAAFIIRCFGCNERNCNVANRSALSPLFNKRYLIGSIAQRNSTRFHSSRVPGCFAARGPPGNPENQVRIRTVPPIASVKTVSRFHCPATDSPPSSSVSTVHSPSVGTCQPLGHNPRISSTACQL